MAAFEHVSFHKAQARKTAELLFRTLPDFYTSSWTTAQTRWAEAITHTLARSVRKRDQLTIKTFFRTGLISLDTAELTLSHPLIARAAARILRATPHGLQGPHPLPPLLIYEVAQTLQKKTGRKCNIARLLRRGLLDWKDVTEIVRQGIAQGCITAEQAIYTLGDGEAVLQLARALRLRSALSSRPCNRTPASQPDETRCNSLSTAR